MIAGVIRGVALFLIGVMGFWLLTSSVQPNQVVDRIILGVLMLILSYAMDIRELLEKRRE